MTNLHAHIQCHTYISHTGTRAPNSNANASLTNLVTESTRHDIVNVDDGESSRLSEEDLVENDDHPPLTSNEGDGEDNMTADDLYPAHDSNEPRGTDTQPATHSQANVETEISDCNLTAASIELNSEAFHDVMVANDIHQEDEDLVLDEKSSEDKIERTPPPKAAHEAVAIEQVERQNDPEKSSEHGTQRSPSLASQQDTSSSPIHDPASQQHRNDSPTHDLREIESFLSNLSDVELSSAADSTTSIGALD